MAAKRKRHEAVEFVELGLVRRQPRSAQEPELRAVLVGLRKRFLNTLFPDPWGIGSIA